VPQIVYYFSSYVDLAAEGEIEIGAPVNFVVPSGNFGDILAGYYAKRMGLPVKQLIVASNSNNVLTEFFEKGVYDANREFHKTISPSMDILVSSNLERLLYEMLGRDGAKVSSLMKELRDGGYYRIDEDTLYEGAPEFLGYFSTEPETKEIIYNFFDEYGYLLDPHTAVGVSAYFKFMNEVCDDTAAVILSTANPYKFPQSVLEAVSEKIETDADKAVKKLEEFTASEVPEDIKNLKDKPVRHTLTVAKDDIFDAVLDAVGEKND
jgi:threonine synthase